ncbi:MAG: hypothetical protein IJZ40_06405, partial [Bacteroidaceae bacterium]|nr:hypothetical protein [Bacteroidaceae bacterium]
MKKFKSCLAAASLTIVLGACSSTGTQYSIADIYNEFQSAPDSTRTKVWWFHGETETTCEGITADLEA